MSQSSHFGVFLLRVINLSHPTLQLYRRMKSRPDNEDTPEQRTGDFADFDADEWTRTYENTDPVQVWGALADSQHLAELAGFAIIILNIVANQAGCERTLSRTKIESADHRNKLGLEKMDKRTKARKNHKSTAALLNVPRYRDLLEDQEDEDPSERGLILVSSAQGWTTEVAKWIGDAHAAERAEVAADAEDELDDEVSVPLPNRLPQWKAMPLEVLFGGAEKPRTRKPSARVMEEEEILMEVLVDAVEDEYPD
ncbi:hypothetical protein B0H11DRAFT_2250139 [Mycena galericulata]|nr:hypothetical protein B0H11DRAFT_2250139 [Mycena galericulata]